LLSKKISFVGVQKSNESIEKRLNGRAEHKKRQGEKGMGSSLPRERAD